jgi:general secretion pathway protein N
MQPSGSLQLSSSGLSVESVQGRWRFSGQAVLELGSMASRLSTLPVLGSYRLQLLGDAAGGEATAVELSTISGALQLSGSGQWAASKLRFSGQASAAAGAEAALNNLLNIIGRRKGALSLISIG